MHKKTRTQVIVGRIAYYVILPALWLYMPLTRRVRVLIVDRNKIMLVKHTLGNGKWCLPGGGIHNAEPAIDAARREIKEELDVDLTVVNKLHENTIFMSGGLSSARRLMFVSSVLKTKKIKPNWEISEIKWVDRSSLAGKLQGVDDEVAAGVELLP